MENDNWRNDFSTEYYLIKRATAKENRKNSLKIIGLAAGVVITGYAFMYLLMFLLLKIWYA